MYFYTWIDFSMNNDDMIDIDHEIESRKEVPVQLR